MFWRARCFFREVWRILMEIASPVENLNCISDGNVDLFYNEKLNKFKF